MKGLFQHIHGDRPLWIVIFLLSMSSFLAVYSASSHIAFVHGSGNTFNMMMKHGGHVILGLVIMWMVHRLPYRYFSAISLVALPLVAILLLVTLMQGNQIGGANASRWIVIPFFNISLQTSALSTLVLMVYLARFLSKNDISKMSFKETLLPVFLPIAVICALVLPANFSTAGIIFLMAMLLLFIGGYPMKYLAGILGAGLLALAFFILLVKAFPNIDNRVDTWGKRIEAFVNGDPNSNYQVDKAKMAIASGKIVGQGPGKSVQKNFLPQSNSDFIYAVITEEYGYAGALAMLFFYFALFMRIMIVITRTSNPFGRLLTLGVGMGIILQALINMGVAVNLLPVTGQTLPLVSAGGSSIWITSLSLGIIQSVARTTQIEKGEIEVNPAETEDTPTVEPTESESYEPA
jgi:cell division protein FtsW